MIDTIKIKSPYLDEETALRIEGECVKRIGLDIKNDDLLYEITTGSLQASYDSRISIKVDRNEYIYGGHDKITQLALGEKTTKLVPCKPYVVIEASVHKAMLGHNCYGGPVDFQKSVSFLISLVEDLLQIKLPNYQDWEVRRVDIAECYELDSYEAVREWFKWLNSCEYPRRQPARYGLTGLHVPGSTTVLKFYHKGVEFRKHDFSRLKKLIDLVELNHIYEKALKIIRCEVEIKSRKLKADFGKVPTVKEISEQYLNDIHDFEVKRFLKEGVSEMKMVRNAHDVERRLFSIYGDRLAGVLLGTWFKLTTLGEDSVRNSMPASTVRRHIKQLKDAGISWLGTDVVLKSSSLVPEDFIPLRNDTRRLKEVHMIIDEKLSTVA